MFPRYFVLSCEANSSYLNVVVLFVLLPRNLNELESSGLFEMVSLASSNAAESLG
jgi:hypothetical protein